MKLAQSKTRSAVLASLVCAGVAALLLWLRPSSIPALQSSTAAGPTRSSTSNEPPPTPRADDEQREAAETPPAYVPTAGEVPADAAKLTPAPLANVAKPARHRIWVEAKYSDDPEDLGIDRPAPGYDGDTRPPQGFVPTRDGKLAVLDSAKLRMVFYDAQGRRERELPLRGLELPADAAIAKDGTLVVVDHEGVQTNGTVLYDENGNIKGKFPQMAGGDMTGMYTVGNDIFLTLVGLNSTKAGNTSGAPTDETPGLYDQNGTVPGHVAPDGKTVMNALIHDREAGLLWINAIEGDPPKHLFSRLFSVGAPLEAIPFVQADEQGVMYVVLFHAMTKNSLACFDLKTGAPINFVDLPRDTGRGSGTPFRQFAVQPGGGLVHQQLSEGGSTYHVFHCR